MCGSGGAFSSLRVTRIDFRLGSGLARRLKHYTGKLELQTRACEFERCDLPGIDRKGERKLSY